MTSCERSRSPARTARGTCIYCIAAVGALALLVGRRWLQMGSYVPGIDAGNWLTFGRQLFGGKGPSAGGAFPPMVPFFIYAGRLLFGAMTAAKLVDCLTLAAVFAATVYVASRGMNRWLALAAASALALCDPVIEPTAFGGYPQNLTIAFVLLSAALLAGYLAGGGQRYLVAGALAFAGVGLSHHAYFVIGCAVVACVSLLWLIDGAPARCRLVRAAWATGLVGGAGALAFLPTAVALLRAGYSAPLDTTGVTVPAGLAYQVSGASAFWVPVIAVGVVYALFEVRPHKGPLHTVCAALVATGTAFYLITAEPRLMPVPLAGVLLSCGIALDSLRRQWRRGFKAELPLILAGVAVLCLYPFADARAANYYAYYRVADGPMLNTAAWIQAHRYDGRFAVCETHARWELGAWIQGLTDADIVIGSDLRWLAFPRERARAAEVLGLCNQEIDATTVRELAGQLGVRFLVMRTSDWDSWQRWTQTDSQPLAVVYQRGEYLIMDVGG